MKRSNKIKFSLDTWAVVGYFILVIMGWISIYGASFDMESPDGIFSWEQRSGKQLVWIATALALGGIILLIDHKIFYFFAIPIYVLTILLLAFMIVAPTSIVPNIKGSHSWIQLGAVSFQPAELAKIATSLALAKIMSAINFRQKKWKQFILPVVIILIPFALIVLQKETGSALVFVAFLLMFYREGMNGMVLFLLLLFIVLFVVVIKFSLVPVGADGGTLGMILASGIVLLFQTFYGYFMAQKRKETLYLLGGIAVVYIAAILLNIKIKLNFNYVAIATILLAALYWAVLEIIRRFRKFWLIIVVLLGAAAFSFSADYIFENGLKEFQKDRIKVLFGMIKDSKKTGYNVEQSLIAIGSGGLTGKGFLNGTQTKLKYVPEQDTDFIFCTVGEEYGFLGSAIVLILFLLLLLRIIKIAERQRENFNRIYGYCVAGILFFHILVNIGMVLGLMPVIGIPLPFFSYGGSSLWSFTVMLFILLRLDAAKIERVR
ncbi:MAG: rod shape-determining protein RodA [Paludibacter sp.]|jgi:rod shape determining protein RodA|nr:rod shape-determining protein RodA [Paludibacter sp.]